MDNEKRKEELIACIRKLSTELSVKLAEKGASEKTVEMFGKCFMNTAETTAQCVGEDEIFLITGDIEAMWLRDSSAQVVHYLPFADRDKKIADMVRGLILKQFSFINIDPYANAYNLTASGSRWANDETDMNDWEWERKYEIDSLCYPVKLLWDYYEKTKDESVFTDEVVKGLKTIVKVWKTEQKHTEDSTYRFTRVNCPPGDTLHHKGMGEPVGYTGMTWSGFRPSDDACKYGYLIPSNLFAASVLKKIVHMAEYRLMDGDLAREADKLRRDIEEGIDFFGTIKDDDFGKIYAYEVDGLGDSLFMDDANVPSLMSLPWLGVCDAENELYKNTRKAVLSAKNPYYYEGSCAKGIGSPHTPDRYIWHIALCMQGLTSTDEEERKYLMDTLISTDAGTGFMHEGFNCDDPTQYTRDWFAWANSLFALYVLDYYKLA